MIDDQWEDMCDSLIQCEDRESHCRAPSLHKENGKNLGMWLDRQRQSKKAGTLDDYCVDRLEEVGMTWNVNIDQWEDMHDLLIQHGDRESHCRVPTRHEENGKNLGIWLCNQRQSKKAGKLDDCRVDRLEEVGMTWNVNKAKTKQEWSFCLHFSVLFSHRKSACCCSCCCAQF